MCVCVCGYIGVCVCVCVRLDNFTLAYSINVFINIFSSSSSIENRFFILTYELPPPMIIIFVYICMCVFYDVFIHVVLAQSKTYIFVYEFFSSLTHRGQLSDAVFRCGRINA